MLTRLRWFVLILSLCLAVPSFAATPTYDDSTNSTNFGNEQNPSYSHTRGATCPNPVAIIMVGFQDGTPGTISSVTYNGVGATSLCTVGACANNALALGATNKFISMWIVKNPQAGSSTVQANFSEVMNSVNIQTTTYCNVNQDTSTGTPQVGTSTSGTQSIDVSSATGELVVDAMFLSVNAAVTAGAGQTEREEYTPGSVYTQATSEEAGASTVTMSWTMGGGTSGSIGVSLKPSADRRPIPPRVFQ